MLTMGRRKFRSLQRKAAPAQQPPFHQEERTGGCRRGAGSKAPPHGTWSKASPGGRPSAGEVLQSLPPAEDPWSPRAPLASPLPLGVVLVSGRPQRWSREAQGGALVWRYEVRLTPVKIAARDTLT